MAIDDEVRDFAGKMTAIADRAPAGAVVTTVHLWRVGYGKLHTHPGCVGLGDRGPQPVTVDLASIGAHRLCGKCWARLPENARRVQVAVTALDKAARGLAAVQEVLDGGDPQRLAVSAGWGLRLHAARARGYVSSEWPYTPQLRAWAAAIADAVDKVAPRADAVLGADPDREVRQAALALMDPPAVGRSGRALRKPGPPPGAVELAPALTGAGQFPAGQDGALAQAWTAWREAIRAGEDPAAAHAAAVGAAVIGEQTPRLLAQVPDIPVAAGGQLQHVAVTAWRAAATAELGTVCQMWAGRFAGLTADQRPTLAAWQMESARGTTARMLLARADVHRSGRVEMAVLPAVCAQLLARDGLAEEASGDVQLVTLRGEVPGPVVAAAAQLWADNAGRSTPLDDPGRALSVAAVTHGVPDPIDAPATPLAAGPGG